MLDYYARAKCHAHGMLHAEGTVCAVSREAKRGNHAAAGKGKAMIDGVVGVDNWQVAAKVATTKER